MVTLVHVEDRIRGREWFLDVSLLVLCLMRWFAEEVSGFDWWRDGYANFLR